MLSVAALLPMVAVFASPAVGDIFTLAGTRADRPIRDGGPAARAA